MTFDWTVLAQHGPILVAALGTTLLITASALSIGAALGLLLCAAQVADGSPRGVRIAARLYVNVFRNTPEMVVIFWTYFCLPPLTGLSLSPLGTGIAALSLSAGAYLAEVFRAGVQAVPRGQWEAGRALGLRRRHLWGRVVLPQAVRVALPSLVSYFTELLKFSTLLAAIGVGEVVHAAMQLGGQTFRYFELFTAVGVLFFVLIAPLSLAARGIAGRRQRV